MSFASRRFSRAMFSAFVGELKEPVSLFMPILELTTASIVRAAQKTDLASGRSCEGGGIAGYSLGLSPFVGRAAALPFLPAFALGLRTSLFERF